MDNPHPIDNSRVKTILKTIDFTCLQQHRQSVIPKIILKDFIFEKDFGAPSWGIWKSLSKTSLSLLVKYKTLAYTSQQGSPMDRPLGGV